MPNGGIPKLYTYGSLREDLKDFLWQLVLSGAISQDSISKILAGYDEVAAAEVPPGTPADMMGLEPLAEGSQLPRWLKGRGLDVELITAPTGDFRRRAFVASQVALQKQASVEAREKYLEEAQLKTLEFMSPAAKAERYRVQAEKGVEGYREVGTPAEQLAQAEADKINALAKQWGQIQTIEGYENAAQQRKAEKAGFEQRYWEDVWGKFPSATGVTSQFMESFTGSPNLQRYMRGRAGEFPAQYAQAREDWWEAVHERPPETIHESSFLTPFYEQKRKLKEQDPLKMALQQYPWEEEFMKLPPAQRGFYPSRTAPPARWD